LGQLDLGTTIGHETSWDGLAYVEGYRGGVVGLGEAEIVGLGDIIFSWLWGPGQTLIGVALRRAFSTTRLLETGLSSGMIVGAEDQISWVCYEELRLHRTTSYSQSFPP